MGPSQGTGRTGSPPHLDGKPWLHQRDGEIQEFGTLRQFPIALSSDARKYSCQRLNRILGDAHDAAARTAAKGDDGTNDLIVSDVIHTGEMQAWFLAEHLVDTPLVHV